MIDTNTRRAVREVGDPQIANLLPGDDVPASFGPLDASRRARLQDRIRSAAAYWHRVRTSQPGGVREAVRVEFDEFDSEESLPVLEALLARIDEVRMRGLAVAAPGAETSPDRTSRGRLLLHLPDRTLETGEAEVASRGFYDLRDRPPIELWLDVLTRPAPRRPGDFDLALLVFVPDVCLDRAQAGRDACPNGSLRFVDEIEETWADSMSDWVNAGMR